MKIAAALLVLLGAAQDGPPLRKGGPKVGEKAPDFELKLLDSKDKDGKVVHLSPGLAGMDVGAVEQALDALKK